MIGIVVFLVMVMNVPFFIEYPKLAPVDIVPVIGIACLVILAASRIEIRKHLQQNNMFLGQGPFLIYSFGGTSCPFSSMNSTVRIFFASSSCSFSNRR